MRQRRRERRLRGDRGASAVEFALLVPIFLMLTFGSLTGGLAFFRNISLTQAARDAGRYGATLPISTTDPAPAGEVTLTDWLSRVRDVAATSAGWSDAGAATLSNSGDGYICIAYVPSSATTGSVKTTENITAGTPRSTDSDPTTATAPCYDDTEGGKITRDDSRVQVVIRRDAPFNAIFLGRLWELRTQFSLPYERSEP